MIKAGMFEKLGSPIKNEEEIGTEDLIFYNQVIKYWRNEPSMITPEMAKNFCNLYGVESDSASLQDAINKLIGIRDTTIDDIDDGSLTKNNRTYLSLKSTFRTYWCWAMPRRTFFFM